MSFTALNFSAIKITEPEDHFLLTKIDQALSAVHPSAQLFIVGDWPRSKKFNKTSYHYELVCPSHDFDSMREALLQEISQVNTEGLFKTFPQHTKKSKKTSGKMTDSPPLLIRLFSLSGYKFKITLEVLKQDSLVKDLHERDFSINALYCDVRTKNLIFYRTVNSDFEHRLLRTLKPPAETFKDQINIIFRMVEFSVRYRLKISDDIRQYFATLNVQTEIYETAITREPSNLLSSVKKFFSKHYVSEMITLMRELKIVDFFALDFLRREEFGQRIQEMLPLLERLEGVLKEKFPAPLDQVYRDGPPKVFFTKTRMYLIALSVGFHDESYALQFLRVFVYNDKKPSPELKRILKVIGELLNSCGEPTETESIQLGKLESLLREVSFDKSQWGLYIVFKILREHFEQNHIRVKQVVGKEYSNPR